MTLPPFRPITRSLFIAGRWHDIEFMPADESGPERVAHIDPYVDIPRAGLAIAVDRSGELVGIGRQYGPQGTSSWYWIVARPL